MRKFMSFSAGLLLGIVITGTWFMSQTTAKSPIEGPIAAAMNPSEMTMNARSLPVQGHVDAF